MSRLVIVSCGSLLLALAVVGVLDAYTAVHFSDASLAGLVDSPPRIATRR